MGIDVLENTMDILIHEVEESDFEIERIEFECLDRKDRKLYSLMEEKTSLIQNFRMSYGIEDFSTEMVIEYESQILRQIGWNI